jgi:hypothetical protein
LHSNQERNLMSVTSAMWARKLHWRIGGALLAIGMTLACGPAATEEPLQHRVVPMSGAQPEHGVERVWGNPDVAGPPT